MKEARPSSLFNPGEMVALIVRIKNYAVRSLDLAMPVSSPARSSLNTGVASVSATFSFPAVNEASPWEMSIGKKEKARGVAVGGGSPITVRNHCLSCGWRTMDRFEALFLQNLIRGSVDRRFIDVAEEDAELVGAEDEAEMEGRDWLGCTCRDCCLFRDVHVVWCQ